MDYSNIDKESIVFIKVLGSWHIASLQLLLCYKLNVLIKFAQCLMRDKTEMQGIVSAMSDVYY